MLKILNVNMSVDPVLGGGTAERTMQLCREFVALGHSCTLLTMDLDLSKEFKRSINAKGIKALYLPCISKRFYVPLPLLSVVARAVRDVDVVHLMGHWTVINALVFVFCLLYRKPYVVCPAGALPVFGRSGVIKNIYNALVGKRIIQRSSGCVAITADEVGQFGKYGIPRDRVVVIPNGINVDDFECKAGADFKSKYGLKGSVILFMGRLNEIKGPDLLLEAFLSLGHKLSTFDLVFIGPDGGMLNSLKKCASGHDAAVHYLGYIGGSEKSQAYHAADLLVIPSRQEAMSIVVLEAGAAATPVLITDQCGFNELEKIGGGRVVSASVKGIADGIEWMIETGELEAMGQRLNEYVVSNYQWRGVARKYISLYESILKS